MNLMNLVATALMAAFTGGYHEADRLSNLSNYKETNLATCSKTLAIKKSFTDYQTYNIQPHTIKSNLQKSITSESEQTTVIYLNSANLQQPYTITISADASTNLNGQIILNGKVLKTFAGNKASMNLSPCLSKGRNALQIYGYFKPANSSVKIELSGLGTKVSQAAGGNGAIAQILIIDVR